MSPTVHDKTTLDGMPLGKAQELFSKAFLLMQLYTWFYCELHGFTFRLEECYRHPSATHGHETSLHRDKLAGHLLLFDANGDLLEHTEDYVELGDHWERLHPACAWGGSFDDGVHFSMRRGGMQ